MAYKASDWSVGWRTHYDGLTLYYDDKFEEGNNLKKSLQCNSQNAPIVLLERHEFRKVFTVFSKIYTKRHFEKLIHSENLNRSLGQPYTDCSDNLELQYFKNYTRENCIMECKSKNEVALLYNFT